MTTEEQFWAAVNWLKTVPDPRAKLLASQAALVGDMREALWICVEHNALHFGETHNTVVQGRAALAGAAQAARGDACDAKHIAALTEIVRMPNAEYVADAHNAAVKYLRARAAKEGGEA